MARCTRQMLSEPFFPFSTWKQRNPNHLSREVFRLATHLPMCLSLLRRMCRAARSWEGRHSVMLATAGPRRYRKSRLACIFLCLYIMYMGCRWPLATSGSGCVRRKWMIPAMQSCMMATKDCPRSHVAINASWHEMRTFRSTCKLLIVNARKLSNSAWASSYSSHDAGLTLRVEGNS